MSNRLRLENQHVPSSGGSIWGRFGFYFYFGSQETGLGLTAAGNDR